MVVGAALLDDVRAAGATAIAIVGTGKNVGKTVTMRALYEAAVARGMHVGVVSAGRDGEAIDVIDRNPKPRLWLVPGTWIASAVRTTRPLERAELPGGVIETACGPLQLARVIEADYYELVGPPTVSGLRLAVEALRERCELVLVDGAIDRLATISGGEDAVIVACGAAAAPTMTDAVEDVRTLVTRLQLPPVDEREPALRIDGALLPDVAAALLAAAEQRQVVVRSPAAVALSGRLAQRAFAQLRLRCEQTVNVIAVTIAPEAARRAFDPRAFLDAVAQATGLPAYDVYAGTCAKPATWIR
ncbi:MAG: DUF1611 domain-containing protein [Candidatus Tyrphobacter sp.]